MRIIATCIKRCMSFRSVFTAIGFFLPVFMLGIPSRVFAAHMVVTPNSVALSQEYNVTFDCDGSFAVFNADTGVQVDSADVCGQTWANYMQPPGNYVAVEFTNADPNGGSGTSANLTLSGMRADPQYDGPAGEAAFTIYDDTPHYSSGGILPLIAPSTVFDGNPFIPGCNTNIAYYEVVGVDSGPVQCGTVEILPDTNAVTYEIQAFDRNFTYVPPSVFVLSFSSDMLKIARNFNPVIQVFSPRDGMIFSSSTLIAYRATDRNDLGPVSEQLEYGLAPLPVSLFYSTTTPEWFGQAVDSADKVLIEKDLPASSTYAWPVRNLLPGIGYRVIADVTDRGGDFAESASGLFTVDFTPPTFVVKTDVPAVKKGSVTITVTASKDLTGVPSVTVAQRGHAPVAVLMQGSGSIYNGVYTTLAGYDGNAVIAVSGTDVAGNTGTTTVSGGTFIVGFNPPPAPIVMSGFGEKTVTAGTIAVAGMARPDTTIFIKVNGTAIASTTPDANGNFVFTNVPLEKGANHGRNTVSVYAADAFDSIGPSADAVIVWEIPPSASLAEPADGSYLSGTARLRADASSENQNLLSYTYQITPLQGYLSASSTAAWTTVADHLGDAAYAWDSTEADNGDYMIRAIVSDGILSATTSPVRIIVQNTAPYARFDDGRVTATHDAIATVAGHAFVAPNAPAGTYVGSVLYAADGASTWTSIPFKLSRAPEQNFSFSLQNLSEGVHQIQFVIKDNHGLTGRASHALIIDRTPPAPPVTKTPTDGSLVTTADDEDPAVPGVQITIAGTAEAGSIVSLRGVSGTTTAVALPDGTFAFHDVTLARGNQTFSLFATDEAGNTSSPAAFSVTYDDPPVITFVNPQSLGGLSGESFLAWRVESRSTTSITISYSAPDGPFRTIVENAAASGTAPFDFSALPESTGYRLRIVAADGIATSTSVIGFSVDRTPPAVLRFAAAPAGKSFIASGSAHDSLSGIAAVEFSVTPAGGSPGEWYEAVTGGEPGSSDRTFSIAYPGALADGMYTISVRAVDEAGNRSDVVSKDITVDTTAPHIGGFFATEDGTELDPDESGTIGIYRGKPFFFAVSLSNDAVSASLSLGTTIVPLSLDQTDGLWKTDVQAGIDATASVALSARDRAGNAVSNKRIGTIEPHEEGFVGSETPSGILPLANIRLRILRLDPATGQYGALASVASDASGTYRLILRAGAYRIIASGFGYRTEEEVVSLSRSGIVNASFLLPSSTGLMKWIGPVIDFFKYSL
ncbi:MAG: hypothetical protein KGH93_02820 [Patescibacteria group bacterium]|nr:hypothetical protein [Patescibacteria group bacterium]MDE1946103.1 hypothetical protein [Patescibacteria group bacterium]